MDRDIERFLRERARLEGRFPATFDPGPILNAEGDRVGTHRGSAFFTVGQRRGLGVASSEPLYVISLDPGTNSVRVGSFDELGTREVSASSANWIGPAGPEPGRRAHGKVRYRHAAAPGEILPSSPNGLRFRFDAPQRAVAPGQSLVLYEGDRVLAGGIIDRASP
jgi:tRNA-specific 2-thiouridylase